MALPSITVNGGVMRASPPRNVCRGDPEIDGSRWDRAGGEKHRMGYGMVGWASEQILRVIESSRFGHIHLHVGCVTAFHRSSLCVCVLLEFYEKCIRSLDYSFQCVVCLLKGMDRSKRVAGLWYTEELSQ